MKVDRRADLKATIHLNGKMNVTNSTELKNILQELYNENYRMVEVDFLKTKIVDSSCLGKLLMYQKKFKESHGELIITNVNNEYIKKMFTLIQLHKVINIVE